MLTTKVITIKSSENKNAKDLRSIDFGAQDSFLGQYLAVYNAEEENKDRQKTLKDLQKEINQRALDNYWLQAFSTVDKACEGKDDATFLSRLGFYLVEGKLKKEASAASIAAKELTEAMADVKKAEKTGDKEAIKKAKAFAKTKLLAQLALVEEEEEEEETKQS
jgi:hypothetical protein